MKRVTKRPKALIVRPIAGDELLLTGIAALRYKKMRGGRNGEGGIRLLRMKEPC
jgi:hypothetical protein